MTAVTGAPPGLAVRIADISVGSRSGRDVGDISGLTASIAAEGLLHPVVLTTTGRMISGARRLAACTVLGWTQIPAFTVTAIWEALEHLEAEQAHGGHAKPLSFTEAMSLDAALRELRWWPRAAHKTAQDPRIGCKRQARIARVLGLNRQHYVQGRELWEATQGYRHAFGIRRPIPAADQARATELFATIRTPRDIRAAYERYHGRTPGRRTPGQPRPALPPAPPRAPSPRADRRRLPQRPQEEQLRAGLASMRGTTNALLAAVPPGTVITTRDATAEDITRLVRDLSTLRRRITRKPREGTS